MKFFFRCVNAALFMITTCLALVICLRSQTVKADDFSHVCPDAYEQHYVPCEGGTASIVPFGFRCSTVSVTTSTSSGDVNFFYCCKYLASNTYCTPPGGERTLTGQIYSYVGGEGDMMKCVGLHTNQCKYAITEA